MSRKSKSLSSPTLSFVLLAILVIGMIFTLSSCTEPPKILVNAVSPVPRNNDDTVKYSKTIELSWDVMYKKTSETLTAEIWMGESKDALRKIAEGVKGVPSREAKDIVKFSYEANVKPHKQYWWRVKVFNEKGKYDESEIWTFKLKNSDPDKPELVAPANNSANVTARGLTLKWISGGDPDGDNLTFTVMFDTDIRFTNPEKVNVGSATSYTIEELEFGKKYYWKVIAKDGYGGERISGTYAFTTEVAPRLKGITLISPADTSVVGEQPVELTWKVEYNRYYWPVKFQIHIVSDEGEKVFGPVVKNPEELSSPIKFVLDEKLKGHTSYKWYVVAEGAYDGKAIKSDEWAFEMSNTEPEVAFVYPAEEMQEVSRDATFSWIGTDADGDSLVYDVYIAKVGELYTTLATNLEDDFIAVTGLDSASTYSLKVVARDTYGGQGSVERKFVVGNRAPVVEILSPEDGTFIDPRSVVLEWHCFDPDGDDVIYHVFIRQAEGEEEMYETPDSTFKLEKVQARSQYFWRVEAIDSKKASTVTEEHMFFTENTEPNRPIAESPTPGATDLDNFDRLIFAWSCDDPDGDALTYTIEIATDTTFETLIASATLEEKTITVEGIFSPRSTYYWRVTATDGAATVTSDVWEFSTFDEPPVVELKEPFDGAPVSTIKSKFSWSVFDQDDPVFTAKLFLLPDGEEEPVVVDLGANVEEVELDFPLTPDTTYTWWVVASDPIGKKGISEKRSFVTGNEKPVIEITGPGDLWKYGAVAPLEFTWEVTDPEGEDVFVEVYFDTSKVPETLVATGINLSSFVAENLAPDSIYYLNIVATDAHGAKNWLEQPERIETADSNLEYLSPEDGSVIDPATATFSWEYTSDDGTVNYIFVLYDSDEKMIDREFVGSKTSLTLPEIFSKEVVDSLLGNRTYYWKIKIEDEEPRYGKVSSFIVEDNPVEFSNPTPVDGSEDVETTDVVLMWNAYDPDNAKLVFDVYLDGQAEPLYTGLITPVATITAPLESHKKYTWHVVARDEFGNSTESPKWTFTTKNNPPAVELIAPENDATDLTGEIVLSWEGTDTDGDTLFYTLYIGTDVDNMQQIDLATETTYGFTEYSGNKVYYWKVEASDGIDSAVSDVWSFVTGNAAPRVQLSVPENGSEMVSLSPEFEWKSEDPDGDEIVNTIYLGEDPDVLTFVATTSEDSYKLTEILNAGSTYYWRVKATDSRGGSSNSEVYTFTTAPERDKVVYIENGVLVEKIFAEGIDEVYERRLTDLDLNSEVAPIINGDLVYVINNNGDLIALKLGYSTTQPAFKQELGLGLKDPIDMVYADNALWILDIDPAVGAKVYKVSLDDQGLPGQSEVIYNGLFISDIDVSEDASKIVLADFLSGVVKLTRDEDGNYKYAGEEGGNAQAVVLKDDVAFVGETGAKGGLKYVDLNIMKETVVDSFYAVTRLLLKGNALYAIADGDLVILNVEDPYNPEIVKAIKDVAKVKQLVAGEKTLAVVTEEGVILFDITDPMNPVKLD